jgi:hypothetical protein
MAVDAFELWHKLLKIGGWQSEQKPIAGPF